MKHAHYERERFERFEIRDSRDSRERERCVSVLRQPRCSPLATFRRASFRSARNLVACVDVADIAARVSFSYYLLSTCVCVWTLFVATYFLANTAKLTGLDTREAPVWPFCCDARWQRLYTRLGVSMED